MSISLDFSLKTSEERLKLVNEIISQEDFQASSKYLEILADYLVLNLDKEEKKEKSILTENRMVTVNKRETSFEKIVEELPAPDDIYGIITEDKNVIFRPKICITKKDVATIPFIAQIQEAIKIYNEMAKTATGKDAYYIRQAIIELRKEQYIIKDAYVRPLVPNKLLLSAPSNEIYGEELYVERDPETRNSEIISKGITLTNYKHVAEILKLYPKLKMDNAEHLQKDIKYLIEDLENLIDKALKNEPIYFAILVNKIDGKTNLQIHDILKEEFGFTHSAEYISSLWNNKIPKLIAEQAIKEYLEWYFTHVEKGKWKKCNRCGEVKLLDRKFYSLNGSSNDGFYSICKECRNKKK